MKLSELAAIVDRAVKNARGEDPEVAIQTANGGCPTAHLEPVKMAYRGSDWQSHAFVVIPATPVVIVNGLTKSVRELAEERLKQVEEAHAQLGFKYIAKSRREEWIMGFSEGIWAHVTACSEEKKP